LPGSTAPLPWYSPKSFDDKTQLQAWRRRCPNIMKNSNILGIMATFAAMATLEKVHILADGRHYFNEEAAKYANGTEEKTTGTGAAKKTTVVAKKVEYKSYARDSKELAEAAKAAEEPAK
jgi:hypothetical protein